VARNKPPLKGLDAQEQHLALEVRRDACHAGEKAERAEGAHIWDALIVKTCYPVYIDLCWTAGMSENELRSSTRKSLIA
jgi:hypothetical protein